MARACSLDLRGKWWQQLQPVRKAAEQAVEATWARIGTLIECFVRMECATYLGNAGYPPT